MPIQRDAFNAGWDATIELLADEHGLQIEAATALVKEKDYPMRGHHQPTYFKGQ